MLQAKNEEFENGFTKTIPNNKLGLPMNERLRIARGVKGFSLNKTIQELSKRGVKCGLSTLQGYEANEESLNHRYPSINMLLALAELYDCSIDYLFGRVEKLALPTSKRRRAN